MIYLTSPSYLPVLLIGIGMVLFAIYRKNKYNQRLQSWLQSLPATKGINIKKVNAYQYVVSYKTVSGYTATSKPGTADIFNTTREVTLEPQKTLRYTSEPVFDFRIENTGNATYKRVSFFCQEYDKHGAVNVNMLLDYHIDDLRPNEQKQLLLPYLKRKNRLVLDTIQLIDTNNQLVDSIKVDKEIMQPPYLSTSFSLIVIPMVVLTFIETFTGFPHSMNEKWGILFVLSFFLMVRSFAGAVFTLLALGIGIFSFLLGSKIIFLLCMLYLALAWGRLKSPMDLLNPALSNKRFKS